jgi:hypothetical protein
MMTGTAVWQVGEDGRPRHNWVERNAFEVYGVISRKGGKVNVFVGRQRFRRRMSEMGGGQKRKWPRWNGMSVLHPNNGHRSIGSASPFGANFGRSSRMTSATPVASISRYRRNALIRYGNRAAIFSELTEPRKPDVCGGATRLARQGSNER